MWALNLINVENRGDFGVTEVAVMLQWSLTLNHNYGVGKSFIKQR